MWVPLQIDPSSTTLEAQFAVAGRLLRSVSLAEAQSRVAAGAGDLYRRFPMYVRAGDGATVEPLQKILARHDRYPLLVLLGAVGLVLLIACANRANLLLARGVTRAPEVTLRAALGATRSRIVRQLITESVVPAAYSLIGVVGGSASALLAARVLKSFLFGLPPWDPGAFAIAVIVLVLVATVAAWIPARYAAGIDALTALRGDQETLSVQTRV